MIAHTDDNNEMLLFVEKAIQNLQTTFFLPEDSIIKQGDESEFLCFISRGYAEIYVKDLSSKEQLVHTLSEGTIIGVIILNCFIKLM
jgi:CRP-like cAMP-binding protein